MGTIKLNELENLAAQTAKIISANIKDGEVIDYSDIFCYDNRKPNLYYHDFKEFMEKLTNRNGDYTTWKSAFDKAMIYWVTTPANYSSSIKSMFDIDSNAGGLPIYIPRQFQEQEIKNYFHTLAWYSAAGWNKTGW